MNATIREIGSAGRVRMDPSPETIPLQLESSPVGACAKRDMKPGGDTLPLSRAAALARSAMRAKAVALRPSSHALIPGETLSPLPLAPLCASTFAALRVLEAGAAATGPGGAGGGASPDPMTSSKKYHKAFQVTRSTSFSRVPSRLCTDATCARSTSSGIALRPSYHMSQYAEEARGAPGW